MRPCLFFTVCLGFFSVFSAQATDLVLGKPAPAYEIKTLAGKSITPAVAKGRILIIHLWATWCEQCVKEMPEVEAFYQRYHDRGVDVVAVSLDDRSDKDKVNQAMKSFSFPAAMEADSDLHRLGRIWRVPVTFVIDQNGILRRNGWDGDPQVDVTILEKTVTPWLTSPASN